MADVDPELSGPDTDDDDTPTPTPAPPAPKPPVADDAPAPKTDTPKPDARETRDDPELRDAALRKANREAAERRAHIKRLEAELDDLRLSAASAQEREVAAARKSAAEEKDAELRPAVVKANARAVLAGAGVTDAKARETLLRLIDIKAVELGEDGDVIGGLEEQVEELKSQFPEKFAPPTPRIPSPAQVDAGDKKPPAREKTVAEQLAERLGIKA